MTRKPLLAALALACLAVPILAPLAAFAAEVATVGDTAVVLPWGQWVVAIAETAKEILIPVAITFITALVGRLGWFAQMWFTNQRIDRMVRLAADYATNAVKGAVAGKAASIDIAPILLRVGVERAVGSTESWVTKAAGGPKGIAERLFRTFHFDESVTDANTLTPVVNSLPRNGQ